jgi:hypothetical protein
MSLEMAHKVILPPKKNYIPQFLKQRDINSYSCLLPYSTVLLCLYLSQSQEDTLGNRLNLLFAVSGEQSHEASFTVLKQAVPQQFLMLEILRTNTHIAEDKALNSRSNQFMIKFTV